MSLHGDAIAGMSGPIIERAARLHVHVGNGPKERSVPIKGTSYDGRRPWITVRGAPGREPDEKRRAAWSLRRVQGAVNDPMVRLE